MKLFKFLLVVVAFFTTAFVVDCILAASDCYWGHRAQACREIQFWMP